MTITAASRLLRAPFRTACRNSEGEMRSPRADFAIRLPGGSGSPVDRHKDRSARSVLNRGSVLKAKRAKHPSANAAGNPALELSHRVEPVASAASVSAGRRARRTTSSAPPRALRGHWLDNAPFGAPPPFSWRGCCAQDSGADDAPREQICLLLSPRAGRGRFASGATQIG
jgi:hypothetical protein